MSIISGDIGVFCPSYKRSAVRSSTQKMFPFATLVVSESEKRKYEISGNRVIACPDKVQGNASRVRNWILNENQRLRGVVILDDDYKYIGRWQKQRRRTLSSKEVEEFLEYGFVMAEQFGVYFWGINVVDDKGAYRENMPFCLIRPVLGPFQSFRSNPIRYDENLPLKEDYDISLQHLMKYRKILRFNAYHYLVLQNEQAGGCAYYRNIQTEKEQFDLLRKKWGSDVIKIDRGESKASIRKAVKGYDINPIIKPFVCGV